MKREHFLWVFSAGMLLTLGGGVAWAEGLTVETYCDLTITRLELVNRSWSAGQEPSDAEEAALWQRYGTTAPEYYAFRGKYPQMVDQYLDEHPEISDQIDQLSMSIERAIRQKEATQ